MKKLLIKPYFLFALISFSLLLTSCDNKENKTEAEKIEADNSNRDFNRNIEDYDKNKKRENLTDSTESID